MRRKHTPQPLHPPPDLPAGEDGEKPLVLSVPEAAHLLGIGVTFCWAMVRRGELPTIRLGRRVLIPRAALERLVHASEHEHSA